MTKSSQPNQPDPIKAINSAFELAFGNPQEVEKQAPAEIMAALKSLGVDAEAGWQSLQSTIQIAQGKARLAAAKQDRIKSQGSGAKPVAATSNVQALIDEIKGMLSLSGGQAAIFARKAESMPLKDLESLREQLIRTAARAAKKPKNEG